MAIRIREVNGVVVAVCAAKTRSLKDDIYLDGNAHHALYVKFTVDFESEGLLKDPPVDELVKEKMLKVER